MKPYRIALMICMCIVWLGPGYAWPDEGMWLPHQLELLDLEAQGLKIPAASLYKKDGTGLMSAVVNLGGGTAEFVSKDGLLLTNHHVAYTAIQRASDKTHDYLADGFLARSHAEEIPAHGYHASVLLGYQDVTSEVKKRIKPGMTPEKKSKALERIKKELVRNAEKADTDLFCQVESMYDGNQYFLFTFKRLWDVRLVYAPPQSIGNFGGEIDNWMWPRHTGDFSFLRAYVSPANKGVPYHPDNVPYHPKSYLKISLQGIQPGDFTFVMGYPGKTFRNFTLSELQFDIHTMQTKKESYQLHINFFESAGQKDREVEIRYASTVKGLHNATKNYTGKLAGFTRHHIIQQKEIYEKQFLNWVNQHPDRQKKYGQILPRIQAFMNHYETFYWKYRGLEVWVDHRLGPALLRQGYLVFRTTVEKQKPDHLRDNDFRERSLPAMITRITVAERDYELNTDKAYFKFLLKELKKQDKSRWPATFIPVLSQAESEIDRYVDQLYANTHLNDPAYRLELVKKKPSTLEASTDPLLQTAIKVEKEFKILRDKKKYWDQEREDLKEIYQAGLLDMFQGKIAPDANSTIRITCGQVNGYHPVDGVTYLPQTTLTGVMEKEGSAFPFLVPAKLKELYQSKDYGHYSDPRLNDIATCFINTTNVTGGSSGSPVLNGRGEQVGIIFDMTYESVIGDYYILPQLQRTISVDIRYVLWVTQKFSHALHLIQEMEL